MLRGLARDPSERFDSAREMALALEKCFAPATAAETSEWVERIASPVLTPPRRADRRDREQQLQHGSAEPRGQSGQGAKPAKSGAWHPELGAIGADVPTQTAISSSSVSIVDGRGTQPPTQVSSISVASNALVPSSTRRGKAVGVGVISGLAVVAGAIGLAVIFRHGRRSRRGARACDVWARVEPPAGHGGRTRRRARPPPKFRPAPIASSKPVASASSTAAPPFRPGP